MVGHSRRPFLALCAVLALASLFAAPASAEPETAVGYAAHGPAVEGGGSLAQAPTLTPGTYSDTLERGETDEEDSESDGTTRFYRVSLQEGERLHAAATLIAPRYPTGIPEDSPSASLSLDVLTASGASCLSGSTSEVGQPDSGSGPVTVSGYTEEVGEDCTGPDLFVSVQRVGSRAADQPLPIELQLAVEKAGAIAGEPVLEEAQDSTAASPTAPVSDEPLAAGRSWAASTPVEEGSYVLELVPGQVAAVRLPVGIDQSLRWRMEVISDVPEDGGEVVLRVTNPVREPVSVDGGGWSFSERGEVTGGSMAAPVSPGNRSSTWAQISEVWLPGDYGVMVERPQLAEEAPEEAQAPIRVILTVQTHGEAGEESDPATYVDLGETHFGSSGNGASLLGGPWPRRLALGGAGIALSVCLVTGISGLVLLRRR